MFDTSQEVKDFKKLSTYAVLTTIVVNAIKNIPRYRDISDERLVSKTYVALKRRAKDETPAIPGGKPWH